jgi:hypothetical protein
VLRPLAAHLFVGEAGTESQTEVLESVVVPIAQ